MTPTDPAAPDTTYEVECADCHESPALAVTHDGLLKWENRHQRMTGHGSFNASVYHPAAPDTQPRCGGSPGKPGWTAPHLGMMYCHGCPDCAPDAHSGAAPKYHPAPQHILERVAREGIIDATQGRRRAMQEQRVEELVAEVENRVRAESAVALQEARERAEDLRVTVVEWETRTERAQSALQEATAEVERLRGALVEYGRHADGCVISVVDGVTTCACGMVETWFAIFDPPAASRPLPAGGQ